MKPVLWCVFAPAVFVAIVMHVLSGKIYCAIYGFIQTLMMSIVFVVLPGAVITALLWLCLACLR